MNKQEITTQSSNYLAELNNTQEMCTLLMKTPHFAKLKPEGIFAIVQTAKSLGINPIQALQGGLNIINGKVEMSAFQMGSLIRSKKHSFTVSELTDEVCIIHGKRCDTNDKMTASFTVEEAKKAGIFRNSWLTYTQDMLYARALSRLARRLFPDVIENCYVEGEISSGSIKEEESVTIEVADQRTDEETKALIDVFSIIPDYKKEIEQFLRKKDILTLKDMPKEMYSKVLKRSKAKAKEYMNGLNDKFPVEEMEVANG